MGVVNVYGARRQRQGRAMYSHFRGGADEGLLARILEV